MIFVQTGHGTYRTGPRADAAGRAPSALPRMVLTAPRASRLVHSSVKVVVSSQLPAHDGQSCMGVAPTRTGRISSRHPGHTRGRARSSPIARSPFEPQCGQNCIPANIAPKHDGHATLASADPQYSQLAAPALAGAPQFGHIRDAVMVQRRLQLRAGNGPNRSALPFRNATNDDRHHPAKAPPTPR